MAALPEPAPERARSVLERIIVPLDGSARAERVLSLVVPLSQLVGSELTLLHVLLPRHEMSGRPGEISYPDTLHDRARALATDYLNEVSRNIVQNRVRTKTVIAAGRVSDMILAHAEHGSFSMIAVGARPRPRVRRFLREGIAETVWRKAAEPLLFWTTPSDEDGESAPYSMPGLLVVPVNGTTAADGALEYARQIAGAARLGICLLGVKAARSLRLANGREGIRYADDPAAYLQERAEKLQACGVDTETLHRKEKPADALYAVQAELPPHIVTMAAGRRRTLNRKLFGYRVAQIVRRASNPMIFLPPDYWPPDTEQGRA